jgi:DNA repair protein RecO (recombination protein O)
MGKHSRATRSHETLALVLRRTPYGDADLIVTLFTRELGQVSALARSARKSQRRFGGNLEPLHTLELELDQAVGAELLRLRDARIVTARAHLLENLLGMEAAGKFLSWLRHSAPEHTPEPLLWELSQSCLDELDLAARETRGTLRDSQQAQRPKAPSPNLTLASHGLRLLVACGWRLELEHCVQSGLRCPEGKAAMIDPERGGLVSRAHGGAPFSVAGATRQRLIATQSGASNALEEADADLALQLVERCLRAHAGLA